MNPHEIEHNFDLFGSEQRLTETFLFKARVVGEQPHSSRHSFATQKLEELRKIPPSFSKIFRCQLLTQEQCETVITATETYTSKHGWTRDRHGNYPTTDVPAANVSEAWTWLKPVIRQKCTRAHVQPLSATR